MKVFLVILYIRNKLRLSFSLVAFVAFVALCLLAATHATKATKATPVFEKSKGAFIYIIVE